MYGCYYYYFLLFDIRKAWYSCLYHKWIWFLSNGIFCLCVLLMYVLFIGLANICCSIFTCIIAKWFQFARVRVSTNQIREKAKGFFTYLYVNFILNDLVFYPISKILLWVWIYTAFLDCNLPCMDLVFSAYAGITNGHFCFLSTRYDQRLLLHGQQYIELYRPFPSSGCVRFLTRTY